MNHEILEHIHRRNFISGLTGLACGIGGIGLNALAADQDTEPSGKPHHQPRAKSLIFLNMQGGPSQFETFTYKEAINKHAGKELTVVGGRNAGQFILPHAFPMKQYGEAGHYASDLFPHMSKMMDELCIIESMYCEDNNHPGAQREVLTGFNRRPMPCFGSWISYGLASANKNLPSFVYLANGQHHGAGFLPAVHQGMPMGKGLRNIRPYVSKEEQRSQLDLMAQLNRMQDGARDDSSELKARIEAAELAFRMQMSAPDAVSFEDESPKTLAAYGVTGTEKQARLSRTLTEETADFGAMCLTARRLVERGVRVISISVGGRRGWDQHSNLRAGLTRNAKVIDQPTAALLQDLKERDLLKDTLVLWGGEFGRTPTAENSKEADGRNHFPRGYTMWLAGGGVKQGITYGKTDEFGAAIVENKVHIHDLHATLLWLLGLDHLKLTYRYGVRDQTIADIHGNIVEGIFAT
jgi:hypothetical protein